MSLNRPVFLKLQLGSDLRKVSNPPESLVALQQLISSLFGGSGYRLKYVDEEGDAVTVASEEDLVMAYESAKGKCLKVLLQEGKEMGVAASLPPQIPISPPMAEEIPSNLQSASKELLAPIAKAIKKVKKAFCAKQNFKRQAFIQQLVRHEISSALGQVVPIVHHKVKCDGCGVAPIVGIRYKCTVCENFDYCEVCEAREEHGHPFLKICDSTVPFPMVTCSMEPVDAKSTKLAFKNFKKTVKVPKPKMAFIRHENYKEDSEVVVGSSIRKTWIVANTGTLPWPSDTTLQIKKSNLRLESSNIPSLAPGQEGTVECEIRIPQKEGRFAAVFRLILPDGRPFGEKLRASVNATESKPYQEQLDLLRSMGVVGDEEEVRAVLVSESGDVNKAVSLLLKKT